jgi:hypothetical protein
VKQTEKKGNGLKHPLPMRALLVVYSYHQKNTEKIANPLVNALLAHLLQAAEAQKRRGSALDILLVQALAHEAQGNRPRLSPRLNAPWLWPIRKAMFASLWMKEKRCDC